MSVLCEEAVLENIQRLESLGMWNVRIVVGSCVGLSEMTEMEFLELRYVLL